MGYYGNQPATGDNDSFRILDDLSSQTETFDASSVSVVSTGNDTLTILNHRFVTGQRVVYSNGGGGNIGGLTDSNPYYVIKVDKNIIKLATSYANAVANSNIDLTSVGSGTSHTLTVGFDGINTRFVATYNNGVKIALTRAAQLQISINGVIQQPQNSKTPSSGFGIDSDSVIVFSVAPSVSDVFWGNVIANNSSTFDISDNTVDTFEGDGSTSDFNLSKIPANNQNILVTLDGVVQYPSEGSVVRAYSVTGSLLSFVSPPAGGVDIQVRHIGFAGATTSAVTGFYGRTGNAALTSADDITVKSITSVDGIFSGNVSIAGTITYEDVTNVDSVGIITARSGLHVTGGSVGIGITNPEKLLEVSSSSSPTIRINNSDGSISANQTIGTIEFKANDGSGDGSQVTGSIESISQAAYTGQGSPAHLVFKTNGPSGPGSLVERLRITSSGNIGIGTDTPYANNSFNSLSIGGSGKYGLIELVKSNGVAGSWIDTYGTSGDGNLRFTTAGTSGAITFWTGGEFTEKVRIDSSGRLGIGTIPKTWTSGYNVLQVGSASLVGQSEQDGQTTNWSNNAYFDTNDNRWEYSFADQASQITQSDGLIIFKTASTGTANAALSWTESARFNTSGNLAFPSGQGIDFSATANGSGTTTSELLDDYEEGSFTPQWGDGSSAYSSPAPTYNTQRGDYTKIGNVVYYDIHLITTAWNGAGGTLWAHGLPFASRSSGYQQGGGGIFCIQGVDDASAISNLTTQIAPNTTRIELYFQTASTGANYNGFGVNQVNEAGTVDIRISGFYFTNS